MKYFYDTEFIEDGHTIDLISIGMVAEDGRSYYAISKAFNPKKASAWVRANVLAHLPPRVVNFSDVSVSPRLKEESRAWKLRTEIKSDLLFFVGDDPAPEFWAYYADYDHVALCQLFGPMINLPKGWPMYTRDLKQWCDQLGNPELPKQEADEHHALADARWNKVAFEFLQSYSAALSSRPVVAPVETEALVDEVQNRMDAVVEAAVEWHQAGREGGEWFDAAERLTQAIEKLIELRSPADISVSRHCGEMK